MTEQEALDYVREHLTKLNANPDIYEDGTCNIIQALEEVVVPMLENSILRNLSALHVYGHMSGDEFRREVEKVTKVPLGRRAFYDRDR